MTHDDILDAGWLPVAEKLQSGHLDYVLHQNL